MINHETFEIEFPSLIEYSSEQQAIHINRWKDYGWEAEPNTNGWYLIQTCMYEKFYKSEDWKEAKRKIKLINASLRVAAAIVREAYEQWKDNNNLR